VIEFRWNDANREHISRHGIAPGEAEYLVRHARRPYPEKRENGKFYIAGQLPDGTYAQVVFIIDPSPFVYVIHARPLIEKEKRIYRRRTR
jgi:uncharacterized DUF497 family protein